MRANRTWLRGLLHQAGFPDVAAAAAPALSQSLMQQREKEKEATELRPARGSGRPRCSPGPGRDGDQHTPQGPAYATDAFRSPLSGLDFPGLNTFSSLQILLWCPMGEKSMNVVERTWQAAGFFVNHLSVAPAPRALRRVTAWRLQASPARPRRWPRTSSPQRPRSQVNPLLGDVKCNLELAPSGQRSGNKILELF